MPSAGGSFEPRPLGRHERIREGARGGPGSQETSLRPQSREALVERGGSMHKILSGLVAGIALLAAAPAALAANVAVRVEGSDDTLVPRSTVSTFGGAFTKGGGGSCDGASAGGGLERATAGDWAARWNPDFNDYEVQTVKG